MLVRFFYNLLLTVSVIVFAPIIFVKVILTPKYRSRVPKRLGFGLAELRLPPPSPGKKRIWIHALSVGEVSSSQALVKGIRNEHPEAVIFFSAATRAGERYARKILGEAVDFFVPFPLDLWWSVKRIVRAVQPDVFVLVETDFWPNLLAIMAKAGVKLLLVNGRISASSFANYRRFRFFFLPLFRAFHHLAMQTERDLARLQSIGVARQRLSVLGNLKYDAVLPKGNVSCPQRSSFGLPGNNGLLWVAGSTHQGEEEVIFAVYARLRQRFPDLCLVVAPRNIERGIAVQKLAEKMGFSVRCRSVHGNEAGPVLVLDTLGELAGLYALCDFAFVGGSLVPERGHNPLEPAVYGKPVVFGPHMEDFEEISQDLLACGGAVMAETEEAIHACLLQWLTDNTIRKEMGRKGQGLILQQQGAADRHLALLAKVLVDEEAQ